MTQSHPKNRALLWALLLLVFSVANVTAQTTVKRQTNLPIGIASLDEVDVVYMPPLDNSELLERDAKREPGLLQIAEGHEVAIQPDQMGMWEQLADGSLIWRLRIVSEGALSLSFGFTRFHMPRGGEMYLYTPDFSKRLGPYTARDNEEHGEFWSPVLPGEEAVVHVTVPADKIKELDLELTNVSHAYRAFATSHDHDQEGAYMKAGNCNVDVVCPVGAPWANEIRSAVVYTFVHSGSTYVCSGAAINNTAQDGTPLILTANHCTTSNPASVVFYWNFENSYCRTVGTAVNGMLGDGSSAQNNSGCTVRAAYASSDLRILEMDDPLDPDFDIYLSGWDRTNVAPSNGVCIHHPQGHNKRISFENDPTSITNYLSATPSATGTHIRVADWDSGTTEGGSSGSPLYNSSKRIVGQLHGGYAACSNNSADWYGRLYRSWTGGGTSASRASDWLDPLSTGPTQLAGMEPESDGWMRDTVSDTGTEPSSGSNMWSSPDIWVRNDQDTTLSFTHMHENPEHGQTNYVYVKLRNRGTEAAKGDLHLYWSKASTGLSWSTHWINYFIGPVLYGDQIGSATVVGIEPNGDEIYEFPWNPPNPADYTIDVQHFCLLARFVSAHDPMTVAETTSTYNNTKNNNNIAWKNVTVVDDKALVVGDQFLTGLTIRNTLAWDAEITFQIFNNDDRKGDNFLRHGEVVLVLGKDLVAQLEERGFEGTGVGPLGNDAIIVKDKNAQFTLKLTEKEYHHIGVAFTLFNKDLRRNEPFGMEIFQMTEKGEIVGGETYEIRAGMPEQK